MRASGESGIGVLIHVKFYSSHREVTGRAVMDIELESGCTLRDVVERLKEMFPRLRLQTDEILVSLNKRTAPLDALLSPGDEVSLLPPVTGG